MNKKGFTLAELMVVVMVIGILATIAFPRYQRLVEKARGAEAKRILGQIRDAEIAYYYEFDTLASNLNGLNLDDVQQSCSDGTHFFSYSISGAGTIYTADRCTSGGKPPRSTLNFRINLTFDGVMSGTDGFV